MNEKGLQILLADDYPAYLRLLAGFLGIAGGHRVATAENGADALRKAAALTPDFILLDLFMPDMTGLEVMEKLCEDAATRDIPVGILTGASLSRGERASLETRRNFAFLEQKPAPLADLLEKIEALAAAGLRRLYEFRPDLLVLAAALPCGVNECLTGEARRFSDASVPVIFVAWPPERVPVPTEPRARVRVVRKPLRAGELLSAAAELLAGG